MEGDKEEGKEKGRGGLEGKMDGGREEQTGGRKARCF